MFSDAVQYAARAMRTMGRCVGPVLQDISCLYAGGGEIQELKASQLTNHVPICAFHSIKHDKAALHLNDNT